MLEHFDHCLAARIMMFGKRFGATHSSNRLHLVGELDLPWLPTDRNGTKQRIARGTEFLHERPICAPSLAIWLIAG